jgi:hypothetical protein
MLDDLVKERIDSKKPRKEGLTYIIDKLQGIDKDNFEIISPMIDVVKIYGVFPLLVPDSILGNPREVLLQNMLLWRTLLRVLLLRLRKLDLIS